MSRTNPVEDSLNDKVVVITRASSGFGRGAALAFARAGAVLVLAARRGEVLDEVTRSCIAEGGEALAVEMDVSDPVDVAQLAREATTRHGRIDIWINNAAAAAVGRFDAIPLDDHAQVIETTLLGTLYGCYLALRQFRRQRQGTLINVASVIGEGTPLSSASYAAASRGVAGLSVALRLELAETGEDRDIRVCTLLTSTRGTTSSPRASHQSARAMTPPPADDARDVVDALMALARNPRDEMFVEPIRKTVAAADRRSPARAEKSKPRKGPRRRSVQAGRAEA
ncbi:MAG: SDR family NAD(P)-dependent oxidoreductase [Thermoanaerobaculia bacterium]